MLNQVVIKVLTCVGVLCLPVSSAATSFNFSSEKMPEFPSITNYRSQLIAQNLTTDDALEEMLVEGMDKGILGDYQGAIADFTEVIRLYPNSAEAYYNRGLAYTKLGNYEAAMADYNKAADLDPNLAEVYVDRAQVYLQLKNSSEAIKDLKRAADLFKQQGNKIAYNQTLEMIKKLQ